MTIELEKVGIYGVIGILMAALIIASVAISGMTIPSLRLPMFVPNTGTLIIKLTDAPVDLEHLNITIDSISAHKVDGDAWVPLEFVEGVSEKYFDLLALDNVIEDLSISEVSTGNYTMIKMHIKTCNATYTGGAIEPEIKVPSEDIRVIIEFGVKKQQTTTILIDMEADWVALSHSKSLRPVLKATVVP